MWSPGEGGEGGAGVLPQKRCGARPVPEQEPAWLGSQRAAGLPAEILHSQTARPQP